MAESYTNEAAYVAYRQATQIVLEAKAERKEMLKAGEEAAKFARYHTSGTFQEKRAAIQTAWVPFQEAIARLDKRIKENYAIADENFDRWKGLIS
jgi:hypothetical protein